MFSQASVCPTLGGRGRGVCLGEGSALGGRGLPWEGKGVCFGREGDLPWEEEKQEYGQ